MGVKESYTKKEVLDLLDEVVDHCVGITKECVCLLKPNIINEIIEQISEYREVKKAEIEEKEYIIFYYLDDEFSVCKSDSLSTSEVRLQNLKAVNNFFLDYRDAEKKSFHIRKELGNGEFNTHCLYID